MTYIEIDGTPGSLIPPYNPDILVLLETQALSAAGYIEPNVIVLPVGPENTLLNVSVIDTLSIDDQTNIHNILNAVAVDPTRNNLTDDQQEIIDLQNKINNAIADISAITIVPGGLKDQITATGTGLRDSLLTNAAWNAMTPDAQADLLRQVHKDTLTLLVSVLNIVLHGTRADKFELRYIQTILKGN